MMPSHSALMLGLLFFLPAAFGISSARFDISLQNPCESPSLPSGSLHIVIAGYEEKTCFTSWLWSLGLSNAHVFVFKRLVPERPLSRWSGPCGITVEERLLLPNHGREASVFHSYVLEHYDNPPKSVIFLHGHGPHAYHTSCESIVGRARLFYRSLVSPSSRDSEFARHMISLTRFGKADDPIWMHDFSEASLSRKLEEDPISEASLSRKLQEDPISKAKEACMPLYSKWSVNTTSAGFYTCCAQFILPWESIIRYPKQFYAEALDLFLDPMYDDTWTGRVCWEHVVWSWYQEPAPDQQMKHFYLEAPQLASQYNLTSCSGTVPGC